MQLLQRAHLFLLLALLLLCMLFSKAEENVSTTNSTYPTLVRSLSSPCGSPPLLSLTLGLAVAFFLWLR